MLVVLLLLAIWLYCLLDVLRTDESELKHLSKRAWFAVVFFGFLLGSVLWLLEGRGRRSRFRSGAAQMPPPAAGDRPVGPDDDPEFLRELERRLREGDA
ncbi:MAG: PLDc N-terminal domain-containing protein [Actinomadura sp.]